MGGIKIKEAKKIREKFEFSHLLLLGVDEDGTQHIATHGKSKTNAEEAATMGNQLKKKLGWPAKDCNTKPLERKCSNW